MGVLAAPFRSEWHRSSTSVVDILRTALLPVVLWAAAVNAVLLTVQQAMATQTSAVMQTQGWSFAMRGIGPAVVLGGAGVAAAALAGPFGGVFSLAVTRHLRTQQVRHREAEHNLPLMVLPFVLSIAGCFLFGAAAESGMHWGVLVVAAQLTALGLLLALAALAVLLIESFPDWAGACLAHAAGGLRLLAAALLLRGDVAAHLVATHGFLNAWALYAEVLIVASLGVPALFFGGRQLRTWAAGTIPGNVLEEDSDLDDDGKMTGSLQKTGRTPSPASSTSSAESQARLPEGVNAGRAI
ncbi:hypothetical protein CMQ_7620 [Grosmannia clavigera kw1407]|uniref:Uncharacterized protein n=1 Tax=Grosmannia clavigera (strain kw1407 / UAMH 11150) TaxID=655863 RepID=F0XP63_GROCL|nr:uncharacterized protein CMQ_7620 [Grosmannia clavigera kw1407]EFX00618.1 hypothetical protein CMQ_7620 [Grosmannia clavigera kw1407]